MNFCPNYTTKDGAFEIYLDADSLTTERAGPKYGTYPSDEDLTKSKEIVAYNNNTERLSTKSVYHNEKKGFYFKGRPTRWASSKDYPLSELVKKEKTGTRAENWIRELQSHPDWTTTEIDWKAVDEIEEKLKALKIIKDKLVDIHDLLDCKTKTCEQYNGFTHWLGYKGNLTQEEYDLLKENLE